MPLSDAELSLDHLDDRARPMLGLGQQLEDAAADRVAEDGERVHLRLMLRFRL